MQTTNTTMPRLWKKYLYKGTLTCITGLYIGAGNDNVEIGGVDRPTIKLIDNQPYIPGSSLRGKIRCLLEQATGDFDEFKTTSQTEISSLFGSVENKQSGDAGLPSRLLVRDAYLTDASRKKLEDSPFTDMPYTEVKWENTIDRIKGTAGNPRQTERVPKGTQFHVEFVINVCGKNLKEAEEKAQKHKMALKKGIELLNADYLGGSGSRGYGQVEISLPDEPEIKDYSQLKQELST